MDVLLDTNAVRASGIDSVAFRALSTYLQRTRSRLLIPSVVLRGAMRAATNAHQKLQRDLESVYNDLRRLFRGDTVAPPLLDSSAALTAYRRASSKCRQS